MTTNGPPGPIERASAWGVTWPAVEVNDGFVDVWRQAHYAAQIASEAGKAWGEAKPDDSHSSFVWSPMLGSLLGVRCDGATPFRAALEIKNLVVSLVDADGAARQRLDLEGKTLKEGLAWIRAEAENLAGEPPRQIANPAPDLPEHPIGDGASFEPGGGAPHESLQRLYAAANALLGELNQSTGVDADIRCWPHHFDIAALYVVDRDDDGDMTRTIGVGLTPPDSHSDSGYVYVSSWAKSGAPRPGAALPVGAWNGPMALVSIAALSEEGEGASTALAGFIHTAFNACLERLGDG